MHQSVRHETHQWHETYRSDVLVKRRLVTHEKKLKKLGLLSEPKDSKILDVCCGEGTMLDLLASHGFTSLYGVDLVFKPEETREFKDKPWTYLSGSASSLPLTKNQFDWIVCAHSLHHLDTSENIQKFIDDAKWALKPGGKIALIDHYDSFQFRFAVAMILSPFSLLTPMTRKMRVQYAEEKDYLYDYLNRWNDTYKMIFDSGFKNTMFKRDLFFFYFTGEK